MKRRLRIVIETDGQPDHGLAMVVDLPPVATEDVLRKTGVLARRLMLSSLKTLAALETTAGLPSRDWTDAELEAWGEAVESYRPMWDPS